MSLRELFENPVVTIVKKQDITNSGYFDNNLSGVIEKIADKNRYISTIDYTEPSNFARFGSAKKYYEDSINHINTTYPYDGSLKEKQDWVNSLSDLEYYLYKKEYPKVTGYVTSNGTNQYISFAPRVLSASTLQDIYNTTVENTANNFNISPQEGMTVEFWYSGSNQLAASSRTLLELSSSTNKVNIQLFNGSLVITDASFTVVNLFTSIPNTTWNHYALSVISGSTGLTIKTYKNGQQESVTNNTTLNFSSFGNLVSGSIFAGVNGSDLLSGSVDELRVWNTVRTEKDIGRNWFTHVDGNTTLNNNLCLYYKFNEGKANDSTYASVVLDYSGRGNNGTVINYTSAFRSENSAIDESGLVDDSEEKDIVFLPISYHDELNQYYNEKSALGSTHDETNNMTLYKSFPSWMLEEEEETDPKHLENITQVMSVYLDELYNKIQEITKLRETQYFDTETKIYPFYDKILSSTGFLVPDLLINTDVVESLLDRTDTNLLDEDLTTVKNKIYQNIYNNINYISKAKGTEKSVKSLLRAYGIGDSVVKINLYGDGTEYEFNDTYTNSSAKKKLIDFASNSFISTLYTSNYIRPITTSFADYVPLTLEAQFVFPNKNLNDLTRTNKYNSTSVSLFGIHSTNGSDYTWNDSGALDCVVYALKESVESPRVKFVLTSSQLGLNLTSSFIEDVYKDTRWNFAFKIKPNIDDIASLTYVNTTPTYTVEFYGTSFDADIKNVSSFNLSTTITNALGVQALSANKHIYFGANRTNFTGSLLTGSDVKFVNAKLWADYLTDEEIDYHAKDVNNSGRLYPSELSNLIVNNTVDGIDTLVANWSFDTLTGSNGSGIFSIDNQVITLNSDTSNTIYPIRNTVYNLTGRFFQASSNEFLEKLPVQSTRQNMPETLNSSDMINIISEDDEAFAGTGKKPEQYFFAIEHSMYQVISDEMINWLASVVSFNNYVGQAKNKFTREYNELRELRNKFFQYVDDKPNIEKYIEYYKWIDSSLGYMIGQLKPATAMGVKKLAPIVESHILERNKVSYSLPYFKEKVRSYEDNISVVDNTSMSSSEADILTRQSVVYQDPRSFLTTDDTIVNTKNLLNKNFRRTYEYVQTAGKKINNRTDKENKSVITVNFSAGDGESESTRHGTYSEYSSFNSLNSRAAASRTTFNTVSATTSSVYVGVNSNAASSSKGDRYDNDFKQTNIPAKDTGFYLTSSLDYIIIPDSTILTNRYNNTIKIGTDSYVEPAVEWTIPMVHNMTVSGALEGISVNSPYNTVIDGFANETLTNKILTNNNSLVNGTTTALVGDDVTFYNTAKTLQNVKINSIEYTEQIFPRKDIVGLASNRTKPNYEEVAGTGSNGYDRNSGEIRSFWKDYVVQRKRTDPVDSSTNIGSINCLNYYQLDYAINPPPLSYTSSAPLVEGLYFLKNLSLGYDRYYNSIYSLDNYSLGESSYGSIEVENEKSGNIKQTFSSIIQGDLAYITLPNRIRNVISQSGVVSSGKFTYDDSVNTRVLPKPQFVSSQTYIITSGSNNDWFMPLSINYIYDSGSFIAAGKKPFFNSYNDFNADIRKYNNYSNLPEYTFNNIVNDIVVSGNLNYTGSFLKKYGLESDTSISHLTESNFNTSLINFIDKDTNKIKIKIDAVKKLLPYKGFYPSDRTVQLVDLFQKSYIGLTSENVTGSYTLDETGTPLDQQIQTLIQPLFAPGILFNSIKAGLAVDWPTFLTSSNYLSANKYTNKPSFYGSSSYNTVHSSTYNINENFNARIPFEAILDPVRIFDANNYIDNSITSSKNILFYLDPTAYADENLRKTGFDVAYPKITNKNVSRNLKGFDENNTEDPRYKLGINNFLAEVPNFFLKNNNLTSFISSKQEPYSFDTNKEYRMDITISKNKNFSMFSEIQSYNEAYVNTLANSLNTSGSLFGVPTRFFNKINSTADATTKSSTFNAAALLPCSEVAYGPFLPPYILGDLTLSLKLKPTSASMDLESIFQNLQYSASFNNSVINAFSSSVTRIRKDGEYTDSPAFKSLMPLTACLKIDSKFRDISAVYDKNQVLQTAEKQDNSKWVIQTKFESPLIDYSDYNKISLASSSISFGDSDNLAAIYLESDDSRVTGLDTNLVLLPFGTTGIWSSYGSIPKDGQSVQVSLDDSRYNNLSGSITGSLLEACGFQKETKSIGQLAEEKEISEAVVMIPYKTNFNTNIDESFSVLKPKKNKIEKFNNKLKKLFDKKYRKDPALIPVDERVINKILGIDNYKTQKIENLATIIERLNSDNSIVKLMKAMVKYNLPPHLNWLEDKSIDPFVMYIFEFTHTLDKQDLADIWQGVMPKISTQHEEQEIEIEHSLTSDELFGGFTVEQLNEMNIKFKTFKIKRRANINYYKLTADSADDENFKFKFGNSQQEIVPYYSYNWPYDFFSLVELVKIEAGGIVDNTPKVLNNLQVLDAVDSGDFKIAGTPISRAGLNNNLSTLISAAINNTGSLG